VQVNGSNISSEDRTNCFAASTAGAPVWSGTFTFATADTAAGTTFLRPEDGAFDPAHPEDYYFNTTDRMNITGQVGRSRVWKMHFTDINNPLAGGTITALLHGDEGQQMFDNITVVNTIQGGTTLLLDEDPGASDQNSKVWMYKVATGQFQQIMKVDTARFGDWGVTPTAPYTNDEEHSGIIPADFIGKGWFLEVLQDHHLIAGPLVEGGQLIAFYCPAAIGSCAADCALPLDGHVDGSDLAVVLGAWGGTGGIADINRDGVVDGSDLGALLNAWGNCGQ
jgi:hypothetical protein